MLQLEWDEFLENKLHNIFPDLRQCIVCPRTNRKEKKTVLARLYIGHSFVIHSFLLKGEEPPMWIGCELLTVKHIFLTCSDFLETSEPLYSSVTTSFI